MNAKALLAFLLSIVAGLPSVKAQEAYACYTTAPNDTTLTFYCDNLRSSRPGTTYDLNPSDDIPGWYRDNNYKSVNTVVFHSSFAEARPTSTRSWFESMKNLRTITGIGFLDTREVTSMTCMFYKCSKLTSLDLSHFNVEAVTQMTYMFNGCTNLISLDLSNLYAPNLTDMGSMFYDCSSLEDLNLTNFRMGYFVKDMDDMFFRCSSLTSLDLTGFRMNRVEYTDGMFKGCSNLQTIYVGDWEMDECWTKDMFKDCTSLVGGSGTTYDGNNTDGSYAHIDGGAGNPGYFTADPNNPRGYVCYEPSSTTLTFYYDTERGTRAGTTYNLEAIDGYDYYFGSEEEPSHDRYDWDEEPPYSEITQVVFNPSFAGARPQTTSLWFCAMKNLQSITGLENLNTSEVVSMNHMFYDCTSLRSLDLSKFSTENTESMEEMFSFCEALTTLDLTSFKTGNVKEMFGMFKGCTSLKTIDVSDSWSTASVTRSSLMFQDCTQLVGGQGTTYDATHVDASYAHVDGGPSNPGYLTLKRIDLWIAGIKVTYDNLDDLTGLVAALDEEAWERYFAGEMEVTYSSATNTLTLKNAIIKAEDNYGLRSTMPLLNIKLEGQNTITVTDKSSVFFQNGSTDGIVTFLGNGSLDVKSYFTPIISQLDVVIKDGAKIKLECTGNDTGINGLSNGTRLPTLTLQGAGTELRAKGGSAGSLTDFSALNLSDGITILEPTGATFTPNRGVVKNGTLVANEWVVISEPLVTSFVVDDIYYKVIGDNLVSVTYKEGYNTYSGKVDIPETVTYKGVTYIVTKIDNLAFFDCPNLTGVTIPSSVTAIGNRTFKGCTSLIAITVPNEVISIGMNAFENCTALELVTLGSSLLTVGAQAFHNCPALHTIICFALNPPTLQSNTFDTEHYANVSVYVDLDYVLDYIYDPIWENFWVDTFDAINEVGEKQADAPWFDFQGRKIAKPQKGIYIKGGKKVLVK